MQNENNFEKHEKLKKKLKIAGFVLVIVGAVLALVAFIDFFITVGNPDKGNAQTLLPGVYRASYAGYRGRASHIGVPPRNCHVFQKRKCARH